MLSVLSITIISSIFILSFFIIITLHYFKNKYYKSIKFQQYGPYLNGIAATVICFGIIFQVASYFEQKIEDKIQLYSDLNHSFLQPILDLFIQYPEMGYYYNELFGIKKMNKNVKRNILLENQINTVIFSKIAIPAVYIELSQDKNMVRLTDKGFIKILNTFMESQIFVEYYKIYFKPKIAGPVVVDFMEKHYGI